jgi:hypothetical protein
MRETPIHSAAYPDSHDRELGQLDGLPGALSVGPTVVQVVEKVLGTSQTFIVRTIRQQDRVEKDGKDVAMPPRFTIFLQFTLPESKQLLKVAIPSRVADLMARQRDGLTARANKLSARRASDTRKERGFTPTFVKKAK